MSGFWSALRRAAEGTGGTAEPRPRARFEDDGIDVASDPLDLAIDGEIDAPPAPAAERPAERQSPTVRDPFEVPVAAREPAASTPLPAAPPAPASASLPPAAPPTDPTPRAAEPVVQTPPPPLQFTETSPTRPVPAALLPIVTAAPAPVRPPVPSLPLVQISHPAPPPVVATPAAQPVAASPASDREPLRTAQPIAPPPPPPAEPTPAMEPPAPRITIDHLEIRIVSDRAEPPAPPRRERPAPVVSLDAFLQRDGGRR